MTPSTGLPTEVERYLDAVRATLADLAAEERDDLLGDVEASLVEAVGDDEGPLVARLGPPEEFAAELRASAGLAPPPPPTAVPPRPDPWGAALRRAWSAPAVGSARRLARELAPIWWLARGYLAVAALAAVGWVEWSVRVPVIPRIGGAGWTATLLVLAVVVSVGIGLLARRAGRGVRVAVLVLDVVILVAAVPVARDILRADAWPAPIEQIVVMQSFDPTPGIALDGIPVRNIYPYDRDGRLLLDVQLFDENGRPLDVGAFESDPQRRVPTDGGNLPLYNVFPVRYFEPGSDVVADPEAGSPVTPPTLVTPALAAPGTPSG